jgi:hypothetical protein
VRPFVLSGLDRRMREFQRFEFLEFVFENLRQLCQRCYCVIPDVGEWNIRLRIFNALVMSLAAMINMSVEDNCGIGEL